MPFPRPATTWNRNKATPASASIPPAVRPGD
jgi:hypothetical protein